MVCSSDRVLRSVRISHMARVCGWLLVVRLVVELAVPGVCYARVCGCLQLKRSARQDWKMLPRACDAEAASAIWQDGQHAASGHLGAELANYLAMQSVT